MHLWTQREGGWCVTPLARGVCYELALDAHRNLTVSATCASEARAGGKKEARASGKKEARASGDSEARAGAAAQVHARNAAQLIADAGSWVLLAPRGAAVTVDGVQVPAGARVLRDGAQLVVEGSVRAFFGSEERACIEPAPAASNGRALICPRCQTEIEPGTPAVRCVGCSVLYHQQDGADALACFTHTPACALCTHQTSLDGDFGWTPQQAGFGDVAEEDRP